MHACHYRLCLRLSPQRSTYIGVPAPAAAARFTWLIGISRYTRSATDVVIALALFSFSSSSFFRVWQALSVRVSSFLSRADGMKKKKTRQCCWDTVEVTGIVTVHWLCGVFSPDAESKQVHTGWIDFFLRICIEAFIQRLKAIPIESGALVKSKVVHCCTSYEE